jgi:hypothetical protein
VEHYGIEVPVSAVMCITESHAAKVAGMEMQNVNVARAKQQIIAESDGCFIQIVETGKDEEGYQGDGRKLRKRGYREARLSLAHAHESKDIRYADTFRSVNVAGKQLSDCVHQVGCDWHTKVHCVGDGARWIANQVEEQFGTNGTYLIDFYHLCDYLSAAASSCVPNKEKRWMDEQKIRLKQGEMQKVLSELRKYDEPLDVPEEEAPVRKCKRYMENRPDQLDYKGAIEQDLPIGSGEVESAHRYVVQKRLKLAGAAWKFDNADNMLALRVLRANNEWCDYWRKLAA